MTFTVKHLYFMVISQYRISMHGNVVTSAAWRAAIYDNLC